MGTPSPRNESAASNRMLLGMSSVAQMMMGAARFGRISRMMMRLLLAPSERAASTNSFSRSESVVERTMRAMYGHVKAEMPMASSSTGSASTTSLMRMTTVSVKPR